MAERLLEGEADVTGTGGEASSEDLQTVEGGFGGADASAQCRGGAGGLLGAGAVGVGGPAGRVGSEWTHAGGGGGGDCGPSGPSRLGTGHLGLARPAQRLGRVAGLRLSGPESDADVSRLRRTDETPPSHRGPPVHPGHGSVRSTADRHPVRSDQHFLRRGGPPSTQGPAGALEGETQRLSPADAGVGAGRGRLCAPLAGLCREGG